MAKRRSKNTARKRVRTATRDVWQDPRLITSVSSDVSAGASGAPGAPGAAGAPGIQGPPGALMFPLDPEEPDIPLMIPGLPGNTGAPGADGTFDAAAIDAEVLSVMGTSVIRKYKASDEIVNNSASMQNDDDLFFTGNADTSYAVDILMHVNCASSSPDFKFDFTGPAGATIAGVWNSYTPAGASEGEGALVAFSTSQSSSVNNTDVVIRVRLYVVIAGTSGTVRLRWAQNGAVAVDTKLKAGSWLIAHNQSQALSPGNITPIVGSPGVPGLDAEDPEPPMMIPGPQGPTGAQGPAGGQAFPVGSVFIAVVSTDPATLLGYGTWSAIAAGRVLVGRDSGDTDFDTAEETGGAKTVQSTGTNAAEAAHTHTYTQVPNHVHVQNLPSVQTGNFASGTRDTSSGGTGGSPTSVADALSTANPTGGVATGTTAAGSSHNHAFTGDSTSVVQPYFVVYMWKRTA